MKIIILFLYFAAAALAQDYVDDFPLYIEGDSGYIAYFLNAAAMLASDDQFRILLGMAITVSIVISGWQMLQGGLSIPFKASATILAGIGLMFTPVTVHVVDKRTEQGFLLTSAPGCAVTDTYRVIANVPYIIAFPASLASTFGYGLREAIAPALVPITNSMNEIVSLEGIRAGGGGISKDMIKQIFNTSLQNSTSPAVESYNYNFQKYIKSCFYEYSKIEDYSYDKLFNPRGSIFGEIDPEKLGMSSVDDIVYKNVDGAEITESCKSFYDREIAGAKLELIKTELLKNLENGQNECVSFERMADSLKDAGYIAISEDGNTTSIASMSSITAMKSFIVNAAVMPSIVQASREFGVSGTEMANAMTAALSKAKMQMEGTGGYHFAVEMLPKSIHFIYGIVLFLGILVGASALAQPYQNSLKIYTGYMISFVMFEVIKLALLIVDGAVMFYESGKASHKLAAMNLNGASFANMSAHLDNIATMTALSGTIGTMMIFAIPGILLKGNFFSLMGMMGAGGQKYVGNDLDTALGAKAQKTGADLAISSIMSDEGAMARLKKMGIDIPNGVGALEYYKNVKSQMESMSSGASAMESSNLLSNSSTAIRQDSNIAANALAEKVEIRAGGSSDGTAWDAQKVGRAQAAANVSNEFKSLGSLQGIDSDKNGMKDFMSGSVISGRTAANETIANGEEWAKTPAAGKKDLMKMVKENAVAKTFGSIAAVNDEIMEHGGVDGAIKDMRISAKEKGIQSSSHANKMREKWNEDLKKTQTDSSGNQLSFSSANEANEEAMQSSFIGKSGKIMDNLKKNKAMYMENAAFAEGQQEVANQKIIKNKGVNNALALDVLDAGLKADEQKQTMDKNLKANGADGGLNEKDANKIADALAKIASSNSTMNAGATAATVAKTGQYKDADSFIDAQKRNAVESETKTKAMSDLSTNDEAKNKIIKEEQAQMKNFGGQASVDKYNKEGHSMGFLNEDGTAASADGWVKGRATFAASGQNKNEQGVIAGTRLSTAFNAQTGEALSNVDGVRRNEDGFVTTANLYNPENQTDAIKREKAEHLLSPTKSLAKFMANGGQAAVDANNWLKEQGTDLGFSDEAMMAGGNAVAYAVVGGVSVATAGAAGKKLFGGKKIDAVDAKVSPKVAETAAVKADIAEAIKADSAAVIEAETGMTEDDKVAGKDIKGNRKEYDPENGTSRNAYLRNNPGAHSEIPKKGSGGGIKGLLAGIGLLAATGTSADDVLEGVQADATEFSDNLKNKRYSNATANALGFVLGKDAGNDVVAAGMELKKGNFGNALGTGLRAVGNFGEDMINLGGAVSNNLFGSDFSEMNIVKNGGTDYMKGVAQAAGITPLAPQTVQAMPAAQIPTMHNITPYSGFTATPTAAVNMANTEVGSITTMSLNSKATLLQERTFAAVSATETATRDSNFKADEKERKEGLKASKNEKTLE